MNQPTRVFAALGAATVVLSFAAILIRLAGEAPSLVIAAGRMLCAALVLTPFFWSRWRSMRAELARVPWALTFLAGALLAAHFFLWTESLRHTTVPSSVVLVATDPIFVAIFSPLFLRERVGWRLAVAIAVGAVGVLLIAGSSVSARALTTGNLLALAGAVCAAGYLTIGRRLRRGLSVLAYIYLTYTVTAVILALACLVVRPRLAGYAPLTWLWIILLGLGPQLIGHTSFNWALRYVMAPVVAMFILGEPVGASILAWLILHQPPTVWEIVGGVVIGVGIYLATTGGRVRQPGADVRAPG